MEITIIKTKAEYEKYKAEASRLMKAQPKAETAQGERLSLLALLLSEYEKTRYDFGSVSPIDAIRFRMEQGGLNQSDLIPYVGSSARVSEVLSGKRPLTLPMIRKLSKRLGIPLEALVGEEEPERRARKIA